MTSAAELSSDRRRAAIGTAVFAVGPLTLTGLGPWLLTRWKVQQPVPGGAPAQMAGALLVVGGAGVLANSFVHFAVEGIGTPAPFAPPKHLVVGGLYRFVRNPMYLAMAAAVTGQGLLLGQPKLLRVAALGAIPVALFVRLYEEPALSRKFGSEYARYRENVPRWLPRLTPWIPADPRSAVPVFSPGRSGGARRRRTPARSGGE